MHDRISIDRARWGLAILWFVWGGAIIAIVLGQTFSNKYLDRVQDVWKWFVPMIVPSLSLMLGVVGAAAVSTDSTTTCSRRYFRLAWWLSFGYLACLSATILVKPFARSSAVDYYQASSFFLGPLQGLANAGIGFLFATLGTKQEPAEEVRGENVHLRS